MGSFYTCLKSKTYRASRSPSLFFLDRKCPRRFRTLFEFHLGLKRVPRWKTLVSFWTLFLPTFRPHPRRHHRHFQSPFPSPFFRPLESSSSWQSQHYFHRAMMPMRNSLLSDLSVTTTLSASCSLERSARFVRICNTSSPLSSSSSSSSFTSFTSFLARQSAKEEDDVLLY